MTPLPKDRQDAIDGYREAAKRRRDELKRRRRPFAEDYGRGAIALFYHLEFSTSGVPEDQGPFVAEQSLIDSMPFPMLVFHKEGVQPEGLQMGNQPPMLVHPVELIQTPEIVSIPSLPRLYHAQKSVSEGDEGLVLWSTFNKLFKIVTDVADGEGFLMRFGAVGSGQFKPCQLESASQVMKSIPNDEREAVWHGLSRRDLNEIISGFWIRFYGDCVSTALEEFSAARVKIADVLVGPFEL